MLNPLPPFETDLLTVAVEVGAEFEVVGEANALVERGEEEGVGREERSLVLLPGLVESVGIFFGSSLVMIGRETEAELPKLALLAWW